MTDPLFTVQVADEAAMARLGAGLGPLLRAGDVVCLHGDLGVGKTTLARGLIAAQTGEEDIPSPTFSLVQIYETAPTPLWHLDLYRIEASAEIWELGFEDALETAISLVEWPDKAAEAMPPEALNVTLLTLADDTRQVTFGADARYSSCWQERLGSLRAGAE